MTRRINALRYSTGPEWGTWTPGRGAEQADEVAAEVATSSGCRTVVADVIRRYDRDLPRFGVLVGAAVWVPDADAGQVGALMYAGWLQSDPTELNVDTYERERRRPRPRRAVRALDRWVERVEVPVGPAILEVEVLVRRLSRRVMCRVAWMVFPTGYAEAVHLSVRTPYPELLDELLVDSELMVESIELDALSIAPVPPIAPAGS